jgi:hypothetical protein
MYQEKIGTKNLLDTRLYKGTPLEYKVDYLAKGLIKEDDVLGRIIKVLLEITMILQKRIIYFIE